MAEAAAALEKIRLTCGEQGQFRTGYRGNNMLPEEI
ncbi:unnamed protein product, partial [marine sediment metagenome]